MLEVKMKSDPKKLLSIQKNKLAIALMNSEITNDEYAERIANLSKKSNTFSHSKEINILIKEKYQLILEQDKTKTKREYNSFEKKIKLKNDQIHELNNDILLSIDLQIKKEIEEKKMAKKKANELKKKEVNLEKEKKELIKKVIYKPKLAKILGLKSIKNIGAAAIKLETVIPEFDLKDAKKKINTDLYSIRRNKGFWKDYDWNEETFMLTKKQK